MEAVLIVKVLNMIQAGMGWLASRGITQDRSQALLDKAAADGGRDVTTAEAQTELDLLQSELDRTDEMIGDLPSDGDTPT